MKNPTQTQWEVQQIKDKIPYNVHIDQIELDTDYFAIYFRNGFQLGIKIDRHGYLHYEYAQEDESL